MTSASSDPLANAAVPAAPLASVSKTPQRVRLEALDALRGIAAISVVLLHFTLDFHRDFAPQRLSALDWGWGNYGVHLFFLISGFVILMTAERAKRARDFVVSRFSRLYPPYWAALLVTLTVLLLAAPDGAPPAVKLLKRALVNTTMLQNWLQVGSIDSVYWTLQVEMSFYFILFLLIWRRAVHLALPVMTGLVVWALIDHLLLPRPLHPAYVYLRQLVFPESAYLFTAGMVLYRLRSGFKPVYVPVLVLCALCPWVADYFPNNPPVDTAMAVGLGLVVFLATSGHLGWLVCRPLLFLGSISYSLYLTHHWLGQTFLKLADAHGVEPNLALALALLLAVGVATLLTRHVERPSLRWIRRRFGASIPAGG